MKTMINIKTDISLKREAQKVAEELGLSLSAILNYFMKELVAERKITFTDHPMPNRLTRRVLDSALDDVDGNKYIVGSFASAKGMISSLKK